MNRSFLQTSFEKFDPASDQRISSFCSIWIPCRVIIPHKRRSRAPTFWIWSLFFPVAFWSHPADSLTPFFPARAVKFRLLFAISSAPIWIFCPHIFALTLFSVHFGWIGSSISRNETISFSFCNFRDSFLFLSIWFPNSLSSTTKNRQLLLTFCILDTNCPDFKVWLHESGCCSFGTSTGLFSFSAGLGLGIPDWFELLSKESNRVGSFIFDTPIWLWFASSTELTPLWAS